MDIFTNHVDKVQVRQSLDNCRYAIHVGLLFANQLRIFAIVLQKFVVVGLDTFELISEEISIYIALMEQINWKLRPVYFMCFIEYFLFALDNLFVIVELDRVNKDSTGHFLFIWIACTYVRMRGVIDSLIVGYAMSPHSIVSLKLNFCSVVIVVTLNPYDSAFKVKLTC